MKKFTILLTLFITIAIGINSQTIKSYNGKGLFSISYPQNWRLVEKEDVRVKFSLYPESDYYISLNFIAKKGNETFRENWESSIETSIKMKNQGVTCKIDSVMINNLKAVKIKADLRHMGSGLMEQYLYL